MVVLTGCQETLVPGPIPLDSTGAFAATGVDIESSWRALIGQAANVAGRISGNTLSLSVALPNGIGGFSGPATYSLTRGEHGVRHDVYCPL